MRGNLPNSCLVCVELCPKRTNYAQKTIQNILNMLGNISDSYKEQSASKTETVFNSLLCPW
jgi:hypothetical protein